MAAGISDSLFWTLTPHELAAVLKIRAREAEQESLRFGLVAATIVNVNRRKGTRMVQPRDFFRKKRQAKDFMSVEAAQSFMDGWASQMNKSHSGGES